MRKTLTIFMVLTFVHCAFGQNPDSIKTSSKGINVYSGSLTNRGKQKQWITKDHVIVETTNLQLTLIENEISDLESRECKALLKRDTATLKTIWLKDFLLDEPQNEVLLSKNPIPYYLSLNRTIEKFTILENMVYTSGFEHIQRLKSNGKPDEPIKRAYFHMWIKKFGIWKLATKRYEK